MSVPWRKTCAGCRHINAQEPGQHCYMFQDPPDNACMQNTGIQDEAKANGKLISLSELPLVMGEHREH